MTKGKTLFYSAYNLPPETTTNSGLGVVPNYRLKRSEFGRRIVEIDGEKDIYTPKQLAKDGVYLPKMISNYLSGKMTDLEFSTFSNVHSWQGIDTVGLPKSLAEYEQMQLDAEAVYNKLPNKLKMEFSNDKNIFLASMFDGSASKIFDAYNKSMSASEQTIFKKEGVKENE